MDDKNMDKPIQQIDDEKLPNWMAALFATSIVIGLPLLFVGFILGMQWIADNGYIAHFGVFCAIVMLAIVWYKLYKEFTRWDY